jgi:hypothetical protein
METLLNICIGAAMVIFLMLTLVGLSIFIISFYKSLVSSNSHKITDNLISRTYNIHELFRITGKSYSECEKAYDSIKGFDEQIKHLSKIEK